MFQIDFTHSKAQAFRHGFLKGLAAPVMLFSVEEAPQIPHVELVLVPSRSDCEALAGDWRRVGDDLRAALARHGETV